MSAAGKEEGTYPVNINRWRRWELMSSVQGSEPSLSLGVAVVAHLESVRKEAVMQFSTHNFPWFLCMRALAFGVNY